MPFLRKWSIEADGEGALIARGTVFGHHRLQDGRRIHTSLFVGIWQAAWGYLVRTHSGSIYLLGAGDWEPEGAEETLRVLRCLSPLPPAENKELPDAIRAQLRLLLAGLEILQDGESWAAERLEDGELCLCFFTAYAEKAFWKENGTVFELPVDVHIGMVQDSVLIERVDYKDRESRVDFRYFPYMPLWAYEWSERIRRVRLRNLGTSALAFAARQGDLPLLPGGDLVLSREAHWAESLRLGLRPSDAE